MDINRSDPDSADSGPRATAKENKACDVCHSRKIKCDRKAPCTSCISSNVTCKTSARPPEKRRRVASSSYENEVKSVSERLTSIEKTIHTLCASPKSTTNADDSLQANNSFIRSFRAVDDDQNSAFEGASSFTAHSKQVSQAFRSVSTIATSTCASLPSEYASSLSLGGDLPNDEVKEPTKDLYELPSMQLVLKILRAAKTNPKRYFPGLSDLNLTSLTDMCQKVFFPTEDICTALVIVVNVGLWKMFHNFEERDLLQHGIDTSEIEQAISVCRRSLDKAARYTPLLLDHSHRQIQALLFLVKQKITIFWVVFSIDRGLSLNFGRSPSLQDYDVTASRATLSEVQQDRDLFFCSLGADLAYLQGDIYKYLYSSRAQSESADVKAQYARTMADRMIILREQLLSFETSNDIAVITMIEGYNLVMQSHLALIYQAIPSPRGSSPLHFCDECVSASRAAIKGHNAAWEKYGSRDDTHWKVVINWTYLFSPFTSFIVLFGTVVTLKSEADLKLMEISVKTLKSAAQYSPGIVKLYEACETFFNLATSYMAQTIQEGSLLQQQSAMGTFDVANFSSDLNAMLDEWELGLGGEHAREMSSFLNGGFFPGPE